MTVNMKLPPPTVTGTAIPSNLEIKSDLQRYREAVDLRHQAQDELNIANKKYKKKDKHKTPTVVKVLSGIALALAAFFVGKKIIKK